MHPRSDLRLPRDFRRDLIPTYNLEKERGRKLFSRPRNTHAHTYTIIASYGMQRMEVVIRINALIAITFAFDPWKTDTRGANARPCREATLERDRLNAV